MRDKDHQKEKKYYNLIMLCTVTVNHIILRLYFDDDKGMRD